MALINKVAPWIEHYRKLQELFRLDPEVRVFMDEEKYKVSILVEDPVKAAALTDILLPEVEFGNITLTVNVIPGNCAVEKAERLAGRKGYNGVAYRTRFGDSESSNLIKYQNAFKRNRAVTAIATALDISGDTMTFVIFAPEVAQYYDDNIRSLYGICTKTLEQIAKEVCCEKDGVFFCSDKRYEGGYRSGEEY